MKTVRYIIALLVPMLFTACGVDEIDTGLGMSDDCITLSYLSTRADGVDSYESDVAGIEVLIFNESETCVYYEHFDVNADEGKVTLGERKTFFTQGASYQVYLLANCPASLQETLKGFKESGKNLTELKETVHTTSNIYLTGTEATNAPQTFLMDGVAKSGDDTSVTLNDGTTDNVELTAVLYRAAAKIVVTLEPDTEKGVSFVTQGGIYNYQLVNMRTDTRLLAEGGLATTSQLENTRQTTAHMTAPTADNPKMQCITYTYSHSWENTSLTENITYLIVSVPIQIGDTQYTNNYYKIPVVTEGTAIERNTCYNISAKIGAAGANTIPDAEALEDISYKVLEWIPATITIGGSDNVPSYLYVNKNELVLRNVEDDESIVFASSSDVTVKVTEAYYIDKNGTKKTVDASLYSAKPTDALNGAIQFYSDVPENNLIRYLTIVISNTEGKSETISVTQYPLDYITYIKGYYSTREDFGGTTYASYGERGQTSTTNGVFRSRVVLSDVIYYYEWNNRYFPTTSYAGDNLKDYRMYHIQITSTSADYVLGIPQKDDSGYTMGGEENAKLVSPSFMINSQLGATAGTNTSMDMAAEYCANYIESYIGSDGNTYEYKDWRLPTEAEIGIIIKYQGTGDSEAMYVVMNGASYWSPTGSVANPNYPTASPLCTRCVRDMYDDELPKQ